MAPNDDESQTNDPAKEAALESLTPHAPLARPLPEGPVGEVDPKTPAADHATPANGGRNSPVDFVSKTNAYLLDYIKFADAKAGAILTFAGLVGGGVGSTAPKTLADAKLLGPCVAWAVVVVLAGALACAIGIGVSCLRALSPRTPTATSLTSFPDIAHMDLAEYIARVGRMATDDATAIEYCNHNWTLSRIASAKFGAIGAATRWLRWMLLAGLIYGCIAVAVAFVQHPSNVWL